MDIWSKVKTNSNFVFWNLLCIFFSSDANYSITSHYPCERDDWKKDEILAAKIKKFLAVSIVIGHWPSSGSVCDTTGAIWCGLYVLV